MDESHLLKTKAREKEQLVKCLKDGDSQCEIMLDNHIPALTGKEAV